MKKMPSDANALILTSAFYHPDGELRKRLRALSDQWVEALKPLFSDGEIREIIARENGTPLEPFVLEKSDQDIAVRMARAAFSEKGGGHRFRVVSRETIGFKGGLVITDNLKHYYAERYARGKYPRNPKAGFSFFPAYTPSSTHSFLVRLQKSQAVAEVDENGFNIRLPRPYDNIVDGLAVRALQRNSRLMPSEEPFDRLGLRVDAGTEKGSKFERVARNPRSKWLRT